MQLYPRPVALRVGVEQHVRGRRLLLHQLLAVQRGAARRRRRQTRRVVLRGRKGAVLAVTRPAVAAAHRCFALTRGAVVAVGVARGVPVRVDLRPCSGGAVSAGAAVGVSPGTTGAPVVPDVVALGAVVDEDEEAEGDGEGTVKAAEDHVQEVALGHGQRPEGPGGQEQEQGEGRRPQLGLEGVLVGKKRGVDGDARTAGRAVAPARRGRRGTGLGSLVAVRGRVDGGQPLLLLRRPLELVLLFGVTAQLDEGADEVDACHQGDEGPGAEEGAEAGLPRHPAAAAHTNIRVINSDS